MKKEFIGEFIGTFIIVFLGCGAVATAILLGAFSSLYEIAIMWGIAVTLAVFCSRNLSPAHLNPAVTMAVLTRRLIPIKTGLIYMVAQVFGAFAAGLGLYLIFHNEIAQYELAHQLVRGMPGSEITASMFGEFYPNPGMDLLDSLKWWQAMGIEATGTFILVFVIFSLTEKEGNENGIPWLVGVTVTAVICLFAPFTQCGINPARDFGPRMVALLMGWGEAAFPADNFGFLTVYICGPLLGGAFAAFIFEVSRK